MVHGTVCESARWRKAKPEECVEVSNEKYDVTIMSEAASPQTSLFMKLKFPLYFAPDGLKQKSRSQDTASSLSHLNRN